MTNRQISLVISLVSLSLATSVHAAAGASGGLTLLNSLGNARADSLGQAYTASFDDIGGMAYNPSSLMTLQSGQASFLYEQGFIQDSYGQFMIGSPRQGNNSAWGMSFGYYNGGKIDLTDTNGNTGSVNAETDMAGALGYAQKIGNISVGASAKYLQSKLVGGQYSASAEAVDVGLSAPITQRLRFGAAALNFGTKLTYLQEGDSLPEMYRAGLNYLLFTGRANTTLLLDAPYMVNEKILTPSLGIETLIGPLALRLGYRTGGDTNELTFGAGFALGRSNLDYSFGMMNQLGAQHKISLGMKFGGPSSNVNFAKKQNLEELNQRTAQKTETKPTKVASTDTTNDKRQTLGSDQVIRMPVHRQQHRVYVVKPGDTLGSIAMSELGDKRLWQTIYTANQHLIQDPSSIETGMRIVIP